MNTRVHITMVVTACLAATMTGCGSAPTVFRAQEPIQDPMVQQTSHGTQPHLSEAIHDYEKYNEVLYFDNANGETKAQQQASQPYPAHTHAHNGGACPACEDCPHCKGCPPSGQSCPFCQQGLGGNPNCDPNGGHHKYPDHHFTYSYHRPKNLKYPSPQVPAGAVVWPYYTLKGPSDFFRTK